MKQAFFLALKIWSMICVFAAVGGEFYLPHTTPQGNDGLAYPVVAISVLALLVPWFLVWFVMLCVSISRQTRLAMTPVPSPIQIAAQFYKETGRYPSIEEVASIQQMLVHQRNEAAVIAGVSLLALHEMGRRS